MVRCVDAAAGIAVDVPCTAKFSILLDDGVGDAELAKRDGERDRAYARADNQDMMLRQNVIWRASAPPRFTRHKSHFFAHQRCVLWRDTLAEAGAHHFEDQFVSGIADDRLRIAMGKQSHHRGADFILNLRGHSAVGIRDQAHIAFGL